MGVFYKVVRDIIYVIVVIVDGMNGFYKFGSMFCYIMDVE